MLTKHLFGIALCAATVTGVGASAFAGESTGSGKGGPANDGKTGAYVNSNSLCAFSGLEDEPLDPGTVQNWGHSKDFVIAMGWGGPGANGPITLPWAVEGCNARDFGRK